MASDYEDVLAQLKIITDRLDKAEDRLEAVEEDQIHFTPDTEVEPRGWGVKIEDRIEKLEAPATVHSKLDQLLAMAQIPR
jgi:phage shock protein A